MRFNLIKLFILLYLSLGYFACSSTRDSKLRAPEQLVDSGIADTNSSYESADSERTAKEEIDNDGGVSAVDASNGDNLDNNDDTIVDAAIDSDASSVESSTKNDAGADDNRSCCEAHAGGGCNDPTIEACVCSDGGLPSCCSKQWSAVCVEIVRQRYCDRGVRQCVCLQWKQPECCTTEWTSSFCDTTAEVKCGGTVGCKN